MLISNQHHMGKMASCVSTSVNPLANQEIVTANLTFLSKYQVNELLNRDYFEI